MPAPSITYAGLLGFYAAWSASPGANVDADQAIRLAAQRLDASPAVVAAIAEVESRRGEICGDLPCVLFEPHVYDEETGDTNRHGYKGYLGGPGEHVRIIQAARSDTEAAVRASSWGVFQILGRNADAAGHRSLRSFLHGMSTARGQAAAFASFVRSAGVAGDLRDRDWIAFARAYNGPGKPKQYAQRLRKAYERMKGKYGDGST